MNTIIVVNPHAGRQNILKELGQVREVFEASGAVTVAETKSAEQAAEVIQKAVRKRPDLLVCCGGDGTLNETVNEVLKAGTDIPLGYIPAGTTNDFASSLGISKEPVKAAQGIVAGAPKSLDVGSFGGKKFIYVASFGAFTQSSYATDQNLKNALGHFAYVLEGLKELPDLRPYTLRAETAEGEVFEGEYIFGALSNSTSIGGVAKLDPGQVDLSDGRFELTLVKRPKNLIELNRVLFSLMSGKFDGELIDFTHTKKISFTFEEPVPWSLDGEYASGGTKAEAEVLPKAIRLYF